MLTLPIIVLGWVRRASDRGLATAYFIAGYALMAGYALDSITNPPLFVYGFIPGVGAAHVFIALALVSPHIFASSPPARRSDTESDDAPHSDVTTL